MTSDHSTNDDVTCSGVFPDNFVWSVATSAYQVEGAWNVNGRAPSIWDTFCHSEPSPIMAGHTGDVACNSFDLYAEDLCLVKDLGLRHYRISFSWSRILPDGRTNKPNQAGIDYYKKLLATAASKGINLQVTLFHWDMPQALQDLGGWTNPDVVVWFTEYAGFCFQEFGDYIKFWVTINEPHIFAYYGYETGRFAPGLGKHASEKGSNVYLVMHHMLLAHAKVYHHYSEKFKPSQKGIVGITMDSSYFEAQTSACSDMEAAERAVQFELGWIAEPIFGSGDYPQVMRERVPESRLPRFSPKEQEMMRGAFDFFGLNYYYGCMVEALASHDDKSVDSSYERDRNVNILPNPETKGQFRIMPRGIRKLLQWIKATYSNIPVYILENGTSDLTGTLADEDRCKFLQDHITEVAKAIHIDGCNVKGYTVWSLVDNFEWVFGYTRKYGLHYIDFDDPARRRVKKQSALFYKSIVENNGLPHSRSIPPTKL